MTNLPPPPSNKPTLALARRVPGPCSHPARSAPQRTATPDFPVRPARQVTQSSPGGDVEFTGGLPISTRRSGHQRSDQRQAEPHPGSRCTSSSAPCLRSPWNHRRPGPRRTARHRQADSYSGGKACSPHHERIASRRRAGPLAPPIPARSTAPRDLREQSTTVEVLSRLKSSTCSPVPSRRKIGLFAAPSENRAPVSSSTSAKFGGYSVRLVGYRTREGTTLSSR